jgi:hypothetical protein
VTVIGPGPYPTPECDQSTQGTPLAVIAGGGGGAGAAAWELDDRLDDVLDAPGGVDPGPR